MRRGVELRCASQKDLIMDEEPKRQEPEILPPVPQGEPGRSTPEIPPDKDVPAKSVPIQAEG